MTEKLDRIQELEKLIDAANNLIVSVTTEIVNLHEEVKAEMKKEGL